MFYEAEFLAMLDYLERERGIKQKSAEAVSNACFRRKEERRVRRRAICGSILTQRTGENRALAQIY